MTDGFSDDFTGSLLRAVANHFGVELKRSKGRPRKPRLGAATQLLMGLRSRGRAGSENPAGAQEIDDSGALAIAVAVLLRDMKPDQIGYIARTRATEIAALLIYGMNEKITFSQIRIAPEDQEQREMLNLQSRLAKKLHPDYIIKDAVGERPSLQPDIFSSDGLGLGSVGHPMMKLPFEERQKLLKEAIDVLVKAERRRVE